jgi:SAM-dependent methyltransferase
MSANVESFQLSVEAAEVYEAEFVPALFGEWAGYLADAADIRPGDSVLDVACGTGVVARTTADRAGEDGRVVGLDLNEAMLAVARRLRPDLEWRQGDAADLPFADGSFDVVLCQSGLMFVPDPVRALREMRRVTRPGGTVAVQVWSGLDAQPAYGPFYEIVARHAGPDALDLIGAYFSLGDRDAMSARFEAAGLDVITIRTRLTAMRLRSVDEAVAIEVKGTPLGERITDEVYDRIVADTREAFRAYGTESGGVDVPIEGCLVIGRPR